MAIIKHRSGQGRAFARLDMETVRNRNLSNAEIGLLLRLINLPDSWKYSVTGFASVYHSDGRSALRSQIKSLETKGYLRCVRNQRNKHGQFLGSSLEIFELKKSDN